jgi:hypothetical protein
MNMLEVMLPFLAPVPAPVVVNAPSVVSAPLVAAVVQAPAGVQQLVGQVQDLVIQHVAVVQPSIAMEVEENENEIFKRLFLKRFGRALPETERSDVDDVDLNMDLIDLTQEDDDEMEVAAPAAAVVVVKTESIETPETPETPEAPIDDRRRSSRLERRSLRKSEAIPEKEAPLAADTDEDMAEDMSTVNAESDNTIEPLTAAEAFEMAEQAIAESDAAIAANQMVIDKFYDV